MDRVIRRAALARGQILWRTVVLERSSIVWRLLPPRIAFAAAPRAAQAQDKSITVFAAASMKNALDDVDAAFTKKSGVKVVASYDASSALMKQIEGGAPADVFVSADLKWMDYGSQKKLIKDDTRVNLLGNELVLIAREGFQDRQRDDRAGLRSRQACRRRPHRDRRREGRAGRDLRQSGAAEARRLGGRRAENGDGRERPRRARSWSRAAKRRSASSIRPTPRSSPA